LGKSVEGMVMGGLLAGLYGAGGGLLIGLLAGLSPADAHYTQLNTRSNQNKPKIDNLKR
jgi:hypothetical protein